VYLRWAVRNIKRKEIVRVKDNLNIVNTIHEKREEAVILVWSRPKNGR
jgi:hypothetical protein